MAIHVRRPYLVCYDIADPKRLQQVHRYLKDCGIPLQYSVFLVACNRRELIARWEDLTALIDCRADDVRAYPLANAGEPILWGRQLLPDAVQVLGPEAGTPLGRSRSLGGDS